jgi:TolB-like protein
MRKNVFMSSVILLIIFFVTQFVYSQEPISSLAILNIESIPENRSISSIVEDLLTSEIAKKGKYGLVERLQIQNVIEELSLSMTGFIDEKTAIEAGKIIGAQYIITGRVINISESYRVGVKLINVETSTIKASSTVKGSMDDFENMISTICFELLPDFEFKEMKFFESGTTVPDFNSREYKISFKREDTRYINYEAHFINNLFGVKDQEFKIVAQYYSPAGQLEGTTEWPAFIKKEWETSYSNLGWGYLTLGSWPNGQHTVKLLINNRLIGISSFMIED